MGRRSYSYSRKRGGGKGKKAKKSTVKKTVKAKSTIKKKRSSDKSKSLYERWMTDNVGTSNTTEPSQTDQAPMNQRWMTDNVGASKKSKKKKKSKRKKRPPSAWQKHLMKVFREMKSKDKSIKLGDAMREAKKSYN